MANLKEVALGIATVLRSSPIPEPLPVSLRGQSLEEGAYLLKAIIRECQDADIRLHKVEVDPELFSYVALDSGESGYMDVPIEAEASLVGELRFYRGG